MAFVVCQRCGLGFEYGGAGDCPFCFEPPVLVDHTRADSPADPPATASLAAVTPAASRELCRECGAQPAEADGLCAFCVDASGIAAGAGGRAPSAGSGARAAATAAARSWSVTADGVRFPISGALAIGRQPSFSPMDKALERYDDVSRKHARLTERGGALTFEDLGSRNGSSVNGVRAAPHQPIPLGRGSRIRLGANCELLIESD